MQFHLPYPIGDSPAILHGGVGGGHVVLEWFDVNVEWTSKMFFGPIGIRRRCVERQEDRWNCTSATSKRLQHQADDKEFRVTENDRGSLAGIYIQVRIRLAKIRRGRKKTNTFRRLKTEKCWWLRRLMETSLCLPIRLFLILYLTSSGRDRLQLF